MLMLLVSLAQAQDFSNGQVPEGLNGQLFRPSLDAKNTLWTNDSLRAPDKYTFGKAMLHYANDPVVYLRNDGERTELVSGIWQMDLMVGHTRGPVRFGLQLPVYLRSISEGGSLGDGVGTGETGLGDLAFDVKLTALDRKVKPIGLALGGRVFVPTATVSGPLGLDSGKVGWEVEAIVDKELSEKWLLAANVGTRGLPVVELENLTWDDQLFIRGGLGYTARREQLGFSAEVASQFNYNDFSNPAARPVEGLLGVWSRLTPNMMLRAGAGAGLNSGLGAPKYRVMLGLGFEPSLASDRDDDGIFDDVDSCPDTPEDVDNFEDSDGCPEATPVTVKVVDGDGAEISSASWTQGSATGSSGESLELEEGKYSFSASAGGFGSNTIEKSIPGGEGVVVRIQLGALPGSLMVTAVDEEGNAVPDAVWTNKKLSPEGEKAGGVFEAAPGKYALVVTAPGFRQKDAKAVVVSEEQVDVQVVLVPAKVEVAAERIDIKDSVYFEVNKDIIKSESFELLDEVAETLIAHPELTLIRIEGHTDDRGGADFNKELSQRRAEAVRTYLVSKGVEAGRLEAKGFGEEKPLQKGATQAAYAKNRRVDFFVAERSD
ncbi:MAG: outer membrane protein OmpA-like peptidoglycan-associated protein [Cognaticolwellia sp.]|jgi:outer membrane protein OmpA-like peptidoglycan-associated protein